MRSTVWLRYPWLGFAAALGAIALFGAKLLGFVLALQAYPPLPTPMELRDVASTEPGLGAWTEITDTTLRCDSLIHAGKSNYFASLSDPKGATAHVLAEFSRPEDCRRAVASGKLIGVRLVEPLERIRPLAPGMAWAVWPTRVVVLRDHMGPRDSRLGVWLFSLVTLTMTLVAVFYWRRARRMSPG